MNSVGMRKKCEAEPEDFFTSMTFEALMGELTSKESIPCNFDATPCAGKARVRISNDFDRIWNAR